MYTFKKMIRSGKIRIMEGSYQVADIDTVEDAIEYVQENIDELTPEVDYFRKAAAEVEDQIDALMVLRDDLENM